VINNGSTDGTKEFLDRQEDILAIHQENLGGAGGFYAGMKYMYEHGYEWLWMMDDDGIPEKNQLQKLLETASKGYDVLNALVLDKDNHHNLSFITNPRFRTIDDLPKSDVTSEFYHPFNGTFLNRRVIEKCGLIKKEMFIWGDEAEYMRRMQKNGFVLNTALSAIHYHPKEKGKTINVFPFLKKYQILDKPAKLSKYYYRNKGYTLCTYLHWYNALKYLLLTTIALLRKGRIGEIKKLYYYFYKGAKNDFTN
jgi:rhamnopyranosyl-N-acetylglucosaminyl-diphospho-decaprenol beta-1,3/1,4-galactofuranosyltransferase